MKTSKKLFHLASTASKSFRSTKHIRTFSLTAVLFLLAFTCVGSAATINVNADGSGTYTSIQEAVTNSADGDSILVGPGVYYENVVVDKKVSISSTDGSSSTTVMGSSDSPVFDIVADGVTISGFTISGATDDKMAGISATSNSNTFSENILTGNDYGILMTYSSENTLNDNDANGNTYGIYFDHSMQNTLTNNAMAENTYNFGAVGPEYLVNSVDTSNTVGGKPIYYIVEGSGQTIDSSSNAGTVYCIDCDKMTIKDIEVSNNRHGVYLYSTTNSVVEDVTATDNMYGISLWYNSDKNTVKNNVVADDQYGITLHHSSNYNTIEKNDVSGVSDHAIQIYSSNTVVADNQVTDNGGHSFSITGSNNTIQDNTESNSYWQGVLVKSSSDNFLIGNILSDNGANGVLIIGSENTVIANNTISGNGDHGVELDSANGNTIYNNLFNNSVNIFLNSSSGNEWNTALTDGLNIVGGPFMGGNYWATPEGTGFSQNAEDDNSDGISDNPYSLDGSNIDNYPLVTGDYVITNKLPEASIDKISPSPAKTGDTVTFEGSGTDGDGTVEAYKWESSIDGELSDQSTFTTDSLTEGNHTIYFSVQDNDGDWSEVVSRSLIVGNESNQAPNATIVSISPDQATQGDAVTFEGSATDEDGSIAAYKWVSSIDGDLSDESSFTTDALSPGNHIISFSAQDDDGQWSDVITENLTVTASDDNSGNNETGDTDAPVLIEVLPDIDDTFSSGTSSVKVTFNYTDESGINVSSIAFTFDDEDVTEAATITGSSAVYTATGLSTGSHSAYLYVEDTEGNSNTFHTEFTIRKKSSSSGSSGGGSGGSTTGEKYSNVLVKEVKSVFVNKGSHVSYEFTDEQDAISTVEFDALKNSGTIQTIVEVLKSRSSFANSDAPGTLYQQMNIWVGKSGFVTDENVDNLLVTFKVEKSWMEENNIDSAAVNLYRYADNTWNKLPADVTGEDDSYVYYAAQPTGFSPFAISADSTGSVNESNLKSVEENESQSVPNDALPVSGNATDLVTSAADVSSTTGATVIIVIAVAILLIGGFFLYKKQG